MVSKAGARGRSWDQIKVVILEAKRRGVGRRETWKGAVDSAVKRSLAFLRKADTTCWCSSMTLPFQMYFMAS